MSGWGPSRLIATVGGIGLSPVAPGTLGAAVGVVAFAYLLAAAPLPWQVGAAALATVLGTAAAERTRLLLDDDDPSQVVVDELAGMWVAAIGTTGRAEWIAAFLLFRLFDIWKPFPVRQAEALHGGAGIMADDVLAGVYALIGTHALSAAGLLS